MANMLFTSQEGILLKKWQGNLSSYTQANCQVSLTDTGYRIYRPPNMNNSSNGGSNNMWGGFVLNFNTPPFVKTHTYIILFDVKGQTSNQPGMSWNNLVGWNGGGLTPSPSNVSMSNITSNWQSSDWRQVFYKWTINDDVYKTCTSSYSSFVQGTVYPSYKGFKFGFDYTNTGSLGTDLYINNLRMYDITNGEKFQVFKTGTGSATGFIERDQNLASVNKGGEALGGQFYEY